MRQVRISPRNSEWSVTAVKSSGRCSCAKRVGNVHGVVRRQPDLLALREHVGVARGGAHAHEGGIAREAGVDVGLTEERIAERIVAGAVIACLGAGPILLRQLGGGRRRHEKGADGKQPHEGGGGTHFSSLGSRERHRTVQSDTIGKIDVLTSSEKSRGGHCKVRGDRKNAERRGPGSRNEALEEGGVRRFGAISPMGRPYGVAHLADLPGGGDGRFRPRAFLPLFFRRVQGFATFLAEGGFSDESGTHERLPMRCGPA